MTDIKIPDEILQELQTDCYKIVTVDPKPSNIVAQSTNGNGMTKVLFKLPDCNIDKVLEILTQNYGLDRSQIKVWQTDAENE